MELLTRRKFLRGSLALAGLGLLAGCGLLPPQTQQPTRIPRIGLLSPGSAGPSPDLDAFRDGLRELGYLEGQNLAVEYRYAEGQRQRYEDLAAELVGLPVDVIVTGGAGGAAARAASDTIPIVSITPNTNPVASGLVASLARPGGNVTGLGGMSSELAGKRLELLKEAFPRAARVGVIWNSGLAGMAPEYGETLAAAQALGVQLQSLSAGEPADLERAYEAASGGGIDALVVLFDVFTGANRDRIAELAAKTRLPAISGDAEYAAAGGLLAYGPKIPAMWRRAAAYVDKILKGAKPADLPIEQPTRFEFVVNLRTAQALGLTIPQEVLMQATEVIQ
jgi:putative tryptophan/tyrosine transport system substrate-binding protein